MKKQTTQILLACAMAITVTLYAAQAQNDPAASPGTAIGGGSVESIHQSDCCGPRSRRGTQHGSRKLYGLEGCSQGKTFLHGLQPEFWRLQVRTGAILLYTPIEMVSHLPDSAAGLLHQQHARRPNVMDPGTAVLCTRYTYAQAAH